MTNKTINNVVINVKFDEYTNHTDNLVSKESPQISLSKIQKWKTDFHSCVNFGYPYIVTMEEISNEINLMVGSIPVQRAYLGTELVWERGGINKIITDNFRDMIHNKSC